MINQLQGQVSNLQRELHEGDNNLITQLQTQLSDLQKELHDLGEDQTKKEVQELKEEIIDLKNIVEKNSGDEKLNFFDKRFKQFGEKTDKLISVIEPIGRDWTRRVREGYTGEPLPASEREKPAGKRSVIDMIPSDLIEEQAQEEEGGK